MREDQSGNENQQPEYVGPWSPPPGDDAGSPSEAGDAASSAGGGDQGPTYSGCWFSLPLWSSRMSPSPLPQASVLSICPPPESRAAHMAAG